MNYEELNNELVFHQHPLRAEVELWAQEQICSLNAACARSDFESAVLEAVRGDAEWQANTNADLCSALGHSTLLRRIEEIVGIV